MSSHREAPTTSQDPAADSTDVYAFVSPDAPGTVTIIANYVPLQDPAGGPNFFEFGAIPANNTPTNGVGGDGPVQYDINIDTVGSGTPTITYRFVFTTTIVNPNSFLYAGGPVTADMSGPGGTFVGYKNLNRVQTYNVYRIDTRLGGQPVLLNATPLYCPPCNVGPRTTPNYPSLSAPAEYKMTGTGEIVFAGQRAEAFWVDLGSIFDLGDLRPLSAAHLIPGASTNGINPLAFKNVHSIALQIPITYLHGGSLPAANDPKAVIGVWTAASRQTVRMINADGTHTYSGPFQQVSRLANPLVNEVVVPMGVKDYFNTQQPSGDKQFAGAVVQPELQKLLPVLYPGAFNNLKAYTKDRADLVAIFATGLPQNIVPGFAGTAQNGTIAEMLRLNYSIAPTNGTSTFSSLGLLGGDPAGFPNGRRPTDDVVTIELQAVAGATIPLVDPSFKPDAVVSKPGLDEGVAPNAASLASPYAFPYLNDPYPGFSNPSGTPGSNHNNSTNYTPTPAGAQS